MNGIDDGDVNDDCNANYDGDANDDGGANDDDGTDQRADNAHHEFGQGS